MFRFSLTKPVLLCFISVFITFSMACKKESVAAEPATEDPMSGGAVDDISALVKEDIPGTNVQYARQLNPQGQVQIEGFIENGKKTGQWIEYTPEGDILLINHYVNGLLEGTVLRMTYRNQVDLRINYKQGKMDGQYTAYKFGKLVEERFYKNGKLEGTAKTYDDRTFNLKQEVQYKDGLQDGYFRYYDESGNVTLEYQYKNGEKISGGIVEPKK